MIAPRWRKVLRDLTSNKMRTLLVILSIAVGIFALGMVGGTRVLLARDLGDLFALAVDPHAFLGVDAYNPNLLEKIRGIPGVAEADGRANASMRYQAGPDDWKNVSLNAVEDFNDIRINKFFPETGDWPPKDKEVLVHRVWMKYMGWQVGDTITLELSGGRTRTLRISGSVSNFGGALPQLGSPLEVYVTRDTLRWLQQSERYNEVYLRVEGDPRDKAYVQRVTDDVEKLINKSGSYVYYSYVIETSKTPIDDFLDPIILLLGSLGGLSLLLSGFLVANTISALLAQHVRQVGIMKAIGARGLQIFGMYMVAVMLFGVIALLIAIPAGGYGAYMLANFIAGLFDVQIKAVTFAPEVVLLQVTIGLLVPLVTAFFPILMGIRVTVREAISSYGTGQGKYGTGLLDRAINLTLRLFPLPRPLLLSLRNTFRRKLRLLMTVTTLTLASAIFVGVISVRTSAMQTIDDVLQYWGFDVQIGLERAYRLEQLLPEISSVPGVEAVETWGGGSVKRIRPDGTSGKEIYIQAAPADTKMIAPYIIEGRWLLPEDQNAIVINTDVLKDESDIRVGDVIRLELNKHEQDWVVVGLARGVLSGPLIFAPYDYFARLTGQVGSGGYALVKTNVHDAQSVAKVAKELEKHLEDVGIRVAQVQQISQIRQQFDYIFNMLLAVLLVMVALMATVGGLGLMGTMSINVLERIREIGVMRAIGATNGAILRIVMVEGILIGWISALQGSLIAVPISRYLSQIVGEQLFQISLSFRFSNEGLIAWLVFVTILAAMASFLPAFQASRLTVRDVLAYE
ncbi:MAG: ABC transporter permease [Chloroflexota bacterium]